jgi:hypothetical protein
LWKYAAISQVYEHAAIDEVLQPLHPPD